MMFCEGPCTLSKSIAMSTKMFSNGQSFNVGGCLLHVHFIPHHDTEEDQISSRVQMCTHVPVLNSKYTNDIGYFSVLKTNVAI